MTRRRVLLGLAGVWTAATIATVLLGYGAWCAFPAFAAGGYLVGGLNAHD